MAEEYGLKQIKRLQRIIDDAALFSRHPPRRYDPGHVFDLEIKGVHPAVTGRARFDVEKFVGGGFAGQVYRARLVDLDLGGQTIPGLDVGGVYAIKIMVPASGFARRFRNALYWLAYQGPFAAQVNEAAARTGALWQKLIRRGAKIRFGDERAVRDVHATFFDPELGSYGEINEWVEGRTWKFEIDDQLFSRRNQPATDATHSREYLAKKEFMAELVRLFHGMGAPELARQYEWWTAKSQPNVLKRSDAGDGPAEGLTALDFRAGLALLPFLPMSPVDFKLILKGLARGSLVQFDRGDLEQLQTYCDGHPVEFRDLAPALEELERVDPEYRASLPDITHQGPRLLIDRKLRQRVRDGLVEGWKVRRLVDEEHAPKLRTSSLAFWLFFLAGALPFLGKHLRRLWGNTAFARHFKAFFTSFDYMRRTWRAAQAERLIDWYREGRVGDRWLEFYLRDPFSFWTVRIFPGLLPLPGKWQRFLTEWRYAWESIRDPVIYVVRFYRDAAFRVQWLTEEVKGGTREGMLTPQEEEHVLSRAPDPFIQKYLKCVAVHLCTLPITQVVAGIVAIYVVVRFAKTWGEAWAYGIGVVAGFQFLLISPGSLVRGTYVVYLMIKERNWHNYSVAVFVSYLHYVGYLGFPLQMVKEFPTLSRFMAGRWATKMVSIVPVFGERGALLEHWVFDTFFNFPLTIKRSFARKSSASR